MVHTHLHSSQILFDKTGKLVLEEKVRKNPRTSYALPPLGIPWRPHPCLPACYPGERFIQKSGLCFHQPSSWAPQAKVRPDSHGAGPREAARAPTPPPLRGGEAAGAPAVQEQVPGASLEQPG